MIEGADRENSPNFPSPCFKVEASGFPSLVPSVKNYPLNEELFAIIIHFLSLYMHRLVDWLKHGTPTIKISLVIFTFKKFYLPLNHYYNISDALVSSIVCGKSTDFGVRQTILGLNTSSTTSH